MVFEKVENPKTALINMRVTQLQKDEITQKAKDCNLSVSDYVLRCALGRQTRTRMDIHTINELRILGEQQKTLYRQSGGKHAEELRIVLAAIVNAIDRIWQAGKKK
jgi:hypothetical protein